MKAYRLGLTGSIGMGKTTTAQMFRDLGVPVWDADACVHRLYQRGGAGAAAIAAMFPAAIADGAVDRAKLRALVSSTPGSLERIEAAIHPLVARDRDAFLADASAAVVLLDIPLLFENGLQALCDGIVVVSAPPELQRARVLARGQMSGQDLDLILSRQMPDAEKRARADWVIETSDMDSARAAVKMILAKIGKGEKDA